jgi:ribosomal protein S18 acetylase RimI-like enzyme
MSKLYLFRLAQSSDARQIAELVAISSDGVAVIDWEQQAREENCTALDIGERIYQIPQQGYSYTSATIVEKNGQTAGMLLTFAMPDSSPRNPENRPNAHDTNVFAPYIYLEEPNSWYICGVAFYPQHRGQGLGTEMMALANEQAKEKGFSKLSLVAFEQNTGSVRLYERLGYRVVDSAPVVPHPMIHYSGDALLMTRLVC